MTVACQRQPNSGSAEPSPPLPQNQGLHPPSRCRLGSNTMPHPQSLTVRISAPLAATAASSRQSPVLHAPGRRSQPPQAGRGRGGRPRSTAADAHYARPPRRMGRRRSALCTPTRHAPSRRPYSRRHPAPSEPTRALARRSPPPARPLAALIARPSPCPSPPCTQS
jgi:hypothetical protein